MAQKLQIDPQKLVGFAPDLDPSTPGIFQTCDNVIPTLIGFKSAASPVNAGLTALPPDGQLKLPHLWSRKFPHPVKQD